MDTQKHVSRKQNVDAARLTATADLKVGTTIQRPARFDSRKTGDSWSHMRWAVATGS